MNGLGLLFFLIAAGFTASAIIANIYRICQPARAGVKTETISERSVRSAVMIFAGPSMLFENAVRGFVAKTWHPVSFWLVTGAVLYWSLGLGLLVMEVAIRL
jgi:hypothetical protein